MYFVGCQAPFKFSQYALEDEVVWPRAYTKGGWG